MRLLLQNLMLTVIAFVTGNILSDAMTCRPLKFSAWLISCTALAFLL